MVYYIFMMHEYLKYLFCWGIIYGVIVYIKCDNSLDMDAFVIATVLTIIIWLFDTIFSTPINIKKYEKMENTGDAQTYQSCSPSNLFQTLKSYIKPPGNNEEQWHDKYNLENKDVSIAEVLESQTNIENLNLNIHPPQDTDNAYQEGYSVINPRMWYPKQEAYYTKGSNSCTTKPVYTDDTTVNLVEWSSPLVPPDAEHSGEIINHVIYRHNTKPAV